MSNTPTHIREAQKADAFARDRNGPAAQPDISAVMDLKTREIVHVTVTGPTGSGKSAICAWFVRAMNTAGVPCHWVGGLEGYLVDDDARRAEAIRMYQPQVKLREVNISRASKASDGVGFDRDEQKELRSEIRDRTDELHEANAKWRFLKKERDELQVQLERFRSERPYVVGVNDGYAAAQEQNELSETVDAPPEHALAARSWAYGLTASRYRELVLAAYRCAEKYPVEVIEDLRPEGRVLLRSDATLTDEGRLRLRNLLVSAAIANAESGRG